MINILLEDVNLKLSDYLGTNGNPLLFKSVVEDIALSDKSVDGPGDVELTNSIIATLVSIEEEAVLKNNYPQRQVGSSFVSEKSAVFVNIYVLFSANYENYRTGLEVMGHVVNFFQARRTFSFTSENENLKAVFNLYNIGFENLNNLWTVLGGRYMPSVIYKARVLKYQDAPPVSGPAIIELEEVENQN